MDVGDGAERTVLELILQHSKSDLLFAIFGLLDFNDLARCRQVCRFFRDGDGMESLWEMHCGNLWEDKVFVPAAARELRKEGRCMAAFSYALTDSVRTDITITELCNATWYGRMKASAGEHYTESDPWWQGLPTMRTRFHGDGTFARSRAVESGKPGQPDGSWRFVRSCCGRRGPVGSFIRMTLLQLGRETPTKVMFRHPGNWGWIMDGCWHMSASFPLPALGTDPLMEDGALEMTVDSQQDEAMAFNYGMPMPDDEPIEEEGGESAGRMRSAGAPSEGGEEGCSATVTVMLDGEEVEMPVRTVLNLLKDSRGLR
jgi:hypothetical protein